MTRVPLARRRECWFYLLVSPWLVGFALFQGGPILWAALLSLAHWPLPLAPRFVGLAQYRALAADALFARTLANTITYVLGTVPAGVALGLGLALLLQRERRGVGLLRGLFFLPVIVPGVAMAFVWGWVFNPRYGAVNALLAAVGLHGPGWLYDEAWAMPTLVLMSLWSVGPNMLVYLAALEDLPRELHEAATLDGAGRWARFRGVTWPLLSPITFFLLVANLVGAFQAFTPGYALTRGGPNNATMTLSLYVYFNAFVWGRLGYASALAMVLFGLTLLSTLAVFRLAERSVFYAGGGG